jgi:4-amino-4-deoxy-L-arabinose transferase-like glycosyltransferase
MPVRHLSIALLALTALALATRLSMAPGQLVTFDDVNLAYSIRHFDIRVSQPQPPGYPLFVLEMRLLYWLRFRRVESILLVLGMAGTIASLTMLAICGNRIMGSRAGVYAAWLMLFQPVFWQTGVVSALRMQLAVISIAVAAACWRAWEGEARWVLWSGVALALGAGIRPETGPLLFPLWAASALRARATWKARGLALAAIAGVVLLWLVPAMMASGGPTTYIKANLAYISDQATVSSGLLGASEAKARTAFWRLVVWTLYGALGFFLPAVLAWRGREGWGFHWPRAAFLLLWFAPAFLFAISVHVEDPGQVLAMVPVASLAGGFLVNRALDNLDAQISRWHALTLAAATLAVAWIVWFHDAWFSVIWIPAVALAAGLLLKAAPTKNAGYPPRIAMLAFLLAPAIVLNVAAFDQRGWYYQRAQPNGLDQILSDVNSAFRLTSREQVTDLLARDDHSLRELQRLAGERPGNTVVVFEEGPTTWRKASYYAPQVPVIVLERKFPRSGSPPVMSMWRGNREERNLEGATPMPVPIPTGARIVWFLNPRTEFYTQAAQSFPLTPAGPVWYTDLPRESGSRVLGQYELKW